MEINLIHNYLPLLKPNETIVPIKSGIDEGFDVIDG